MFPNMPLLFLGRAACGSGDKNHRATIAEQIIRELRDFKFEISNGRFQNQMRASPLKRRVRGGNPPQAEQIGFCARR
jgi:hypothetical protein